MRKEIFFGCYCGQNLSVVTEDDKVVELDFEGESNENLVGNIYKGRVMNVLDGMQAAFVYCGLGRNCYLSTDESASSLCDDGEEEAVEEKPLNLKVGDEIMVQVVKPPRGTKGAKVTTKISYVGKSIVYIPNDTFMGVSRKIEDVELRENLLFTMDKLRGENEGMIIRTAAPNSDRKTLKKELEYLRKADKEVQQKYLKAKAGALLYTDEDLFNRTVRDLYNEKVNKIHVNSKEYYDKLYSLLSRYDDGSEKKLVLHTGMRDMLAENDLLEQIISVLKPSVPLESGGNLVIEKTEAMTVIDVNTGKFIGEDCLEETVYRTNLEAAREIARQVRLRNIGGIVTVDFIDMVNEEHRSSVTRCLEEYLSADKVKCRVLPMNDFCVVEFTRKRVNHDVIGQQMKPCPHCERYGYILSDSFCAIMIRSAVSDCFAKGYDSAIVDLNKEVMLSILQNRWFRECLNGKWKGKRVYLIPHSSYVEEKFQVRGDNAAVLHLPDNAQMLY